MGRYLLLIAMTACSARVNMFETMTDASDEGATVEMDEGDAKSIVLGDAGDGGAWKNVPVRSLPGLQSISFYERTGGSEPTEYKFNANGPELTHRAPDPLDPKTADIPGAPSELYDVYYSDENGAFAIDGSYLTISGVFEMEKPWGGGLNLAEMVLHFSGGKPEFGNYVASSEALGDNQEPMSIKNCIDGKLDTHTTMGNTVGQKKRLRLTIGFLSTSGPPK